MGDEGIISLANLGTAPADPLLSMERSSLPSGEYFVTELLTYQPAGKVTVNAEGGFTGWNSALENLSGRTSWILFLSVEDPTTAVENPDVEANIQIMPNPAHDSFQIVLNDTYQDVYIQIYNTAGALVFQMKTVNDNETIQTHQWARGMYVVQVLDAEGKMIAKERVAVE